MRRPVLLLTATLTLAATLHSFAGVIDDAFVNGGGCYVRKYSTSHLAAHPRQLVTQINLDLSPRQTSKTRTTLYFEFTLRNGKVYGADAYCSAKASCALEGDGGSFSLSASGQAIKLTVGDFLALEGEDFSPDLAKSDDQVFLLDKC